MLVSSAFNKEFYVFQNGFQLIEATFSCYFFFNAFLFELLYVLFNCISGGVQRKIVGR